MTPLKRSEKLWLGFFTGALSCFVLVGVWVGIAPWQLFLAGEGLILLFGWWLLRRERLKTKSLEELLEESRLMVDDELLAASLDHEKPERLALLFSSLHPHRAASLIEKLPTKSRAQVLEHLSEMGQDS